MCVYKKIIFFAVVIACLLSIFCISSFAVLGDDVQVTLLSDGLNSSQTAGLDYGCLGGFLQNYKYSNSGAAAPVSVSDNVVTYTFYTGSSSVNYYICISDDYSCTVTSNDDRVVITPVSESVVAQNGTKISWYDTSFHCENFSGDVSGYTWYQLQSNFVDTFTVTMTVNYPPSVVNDVFDDGVSPMVSNTLVYGNTVISFLLANTILLIPLYMFLFMFVSGVIFSIVHKKR